MNVLEWEFNYTLYAKQVNPEYQENWKRATPAARKADKEYWADIYRNAIFTESFRNAEKMLAVIADLESEG